MKQPSKDPRIGELEPDWIEDEDSEQTTADENDDQPYSDEFLDAFLSEDFGDDDPPSYDFGDAGSFGSDGDAEFDLYFRNADSHSRARRRRRHRGHRDWRDALDYQSSDGRPRR